MTGEAQKRLRQDVKRDSTHPRATEKILQRLRKVGGHFRSSWDATWALHVWGFHEAKFDSEDVRVRVPDIEKIVLEAQKLIKKEKT
jgi:hypothetical protein